MASPAQPPVEVLLAQRRHHLCDPNRPRVAAREPHSPRAQIIPIGASRLAQDQVAGGVQIGGCARALSVDRATDDQGSAGRGVRRVRIFMHDRWRREHPVMRIRLGRRALHCGRHRNGPMLRSAWRPHTRCCRPAEGSSVQPPRHAVPGVWRDCAERAPPRFPSNRSLMAASGLPSSYLYLPCQLRALVLLDGPHVPVWILEEAIA